MTKLYLMDYDKIKITHIRTSHGVFGAERVILGLLESSDKDGFEINVTLIGSEPGLNKDFKTALSDIEIPFFDFQFNGRLDIRGIMKLRNHLIEKKIDIIHCHDFKAVFYGLFASVGTNIKRVATHHGSTKDSFLLKCYLGLNEYLFLRFFHKVVVVSKQLSNEPWARILKEKIVFIPNGINTEFIKKPLPLKNESSISIPPNKRVLGIVGRLFPDKGHKHLFNAFRLLGKEFKDLILLVVGDGPEMANLKRLSSKLGLEKDIIFCGVRENMTYIYSLLDYFIMPSLREGLPMALLEAMLAEIPVIASKVGEIPSVIGDNDRGRLTEPGNAQSIYDAIKYLLLNDNSRIQMVEKASSFVISNYSARAMAGKIENIYVNLKK